VFEFVVVIVVVALRVSKYFIKTLFGRRWAKCKTFICQKSSNSRGSISLSLYLSLSLSRSVCVSRALGVWAWLMSSSWQYMQLL